MWWRLKAELTLTLPSLLLSLSDRHHRLPPSPLEVEAASLASSTCCASEQKKLSRDFLPISVLKLPAVLVRLVLIRGRTR